MHVFNDQGFNDMLTNDIVSFEQLGLGLVKFGFNLLRQGQIRVSFQVFQNIGMKHIKS